MSDYGELKRLAEAVQEGFVAPTAYEEDRRYSDGEVALLDFLEKATPAVVVALINENTSLKGSCKALGGRHLRYLERYIRVVERKNAKHVANRNEFVSCMERKGEEIDNLKAENKTLLEALEDMVVTYEYEASSENPSLLAAKAAIENARKTAAK